MGRGILTKLCADSYAMATPLFTPLNVTLLTILLTLSYFRLRPSSPPSLPAGPSPIVFQTFTPRTLLKYNGENQSPVYLAVRGKVYDVSSGRNFYGPGGPYENFAGRDATRGLACQSFDAEMLTKDLDGPLDTCEDLNAEQLDNLKGWIERFDEKVIKYNPLYCSWYREWHWIELTLLCNLQYLVVGKLIAFRKTDFH